MLRIIYLYFRCIWCNSLFFIIGTLARKCNILDVYDEHVAVYQDLKSFSHYIPRQSCFICLEAQCKLGTEGCETVEFDELPLYHNMLEFGFFGNDLPKKGLVRMPMSTECYFQIEMNATFGNPKLDTKTKVKIFFWQCQYFDSECESRHATKAMEVEWSGCIFISVMLATARMYQIFASVSYDCINLASAVRTAEQFLDIQREECWFSNFKKVPNTNFLFFLDSGRRHEGLVIILPCSSGGYVVNPINGRFVYDYYCKTLFFPEVHGDAIEQIIEEHYFGFENLQFPSHFEVIANREEEFRPLYINENGTVKSPKEMRPVVRKRQAIFRDRCDLYVKKPFNSLNQALKLVGDKVLSTKLIELDTTIPFGRTIKTTSNITTTTSKANVTTPITPTTTTTEILPFISSLGATFLPGADPVKEILQVTYRNQAFDILLTFERELGVFSPVKTLAPGEPPPPTPPITLWVPDYEDMIENRIEYGEETPLKANNYSKQHEPVILITNPIVKHDLIYGRFTREKSLGIDYFENLTSINLNAAKGTNLPDFWISWLYILSNFYVWLFIIPHF